MLKCLLMMLASNIFFLDFVRTFKSKFYQGYVHESNQKYMDYVLQKFNTINGEVILAHLLWCTRNSLLANCDLYVKVVRFYNDMPEGFVCNRFYNALWDKKIEKVFDERYCYLGMNIRQLCVCDNIENVCNFSTFINFFGVIAVRLFFNIGKQFIFTVRLRNESFFTFFSDQSKTIFARICANLEQDTVENIIRELIPLTDYNPAFLKITNEHYTKYLSCT